jgi:TetR/AcrR family transcriptional regulator
VRALPPALRSKVLASAELFAERGLDATKMEDVAAASGVPKATLYYYFEGKEAILAFLFTEVLDEVEQAVAGAISAEGTAAERLEAAITAHLDVFRRFPAASRALQLDLGRAARLPVVASRTDAAFIDPVQALLVEGAADGSLRPVEQPRLAAIAILGAVTTIGLHAVGPRRQARPAARELVRLVTEGVAA